MYKQLSIEEVNNHYKMIVSVEKQEEKYKADLTKAWANFFGKLFKSYLGR